MKTIILAVVGLLILSPLVKAESLDLKSADLYMVTYFEMKQSKDIFAGLKINIANYQELFYFNLGFVVSDMTLAKKVILGGLSLNLKTLLSKWGWNWKIAESLLLGANTGIDLLSPDRDIYAGWDINIKF